MGDAATLRRRLSLAIRIVAFAGLLAILAAPCSQGSAASGELDRSQFGEPVPVEENDAGQFGIRSRHLPICEHARRTSLHC